MKAVTKGWVWFSALLALSWTALAAGIALNSALGAVFWVAGMGGCVGVPLVFAEVVWPKAIATDVRAELAAQEERRQLAEAEAEVDDFMMDLELGL